MNRLTGWAEWRRERQHFPLRAATRARQGRSERP
jgi:hypothetical protein